MPALFSIHHHAQVIGRSKGRSAVAVAAYRTGTRMTDERTGDVHDYTRKGGVVFFETLLPDHAPASLADASVLWNLVEASERNANAQLCREFDIALPRELTREQNTELARAYCQTLVDEGMCCTWAYHDPGLSNRNPHIHVMLTLREVTAEGAFAPKAHKEYLCRKGGEERYMSAADFRESKGDGWEKVYRYRKGSEWRSLTPSEAEAWPGCRRQGKDAVDRKVDATDWNDRGQRDPDTGEIIRPGKVEVWRERWAVMVNDHLRLAGEGKEYDHRSFERRGIERVPQVHLGPTASMMERRGIETVQGEKNRQIAALNFGIREVAQLRDGSGEAGSDFALASRDELEDLVHDALQQGEAVAARRFDTVEEVRDFGTPFARWLDEKLGHLRNVLLGVVRRFAGSGGGRREPEALDDLKAAARERAARRVADETVRRKPSRPRDVER